MAKENKKAAEAALEPTTVDNIREQLDKASLSRTELTEAVRKKIKEEHDENIQNQLKERVQQANWDVDETRLKLRHQRDIADIQKYDMAQVGRLNRFMMGFEVNEQTLEYASGAPDDLFEREEVDEKNQTITIKTGDKKTTYKMGDTVPPIIDYTDFDELRRKIRKAVSKKIDDAQEVHNKYENKLQAAYDKYWRPSWRY